VRIDLLEIMSYLLLFLSYDFDLEIIYIWSSIKRTYVIFSDLSTLVVHLHSGCMEALFAHDTFPRCKSLGYHIVVKF
jgi:hypothetical protein